MVGFFIRLSLLALVMSYSIGVVYSETQLRSGTNASCVNPTTGVFKESSCKGSFVKIVFIKFDDIPVSTTTVSGGSSTTVVGGSSTTVVGGSSTTVVGGSSTTVIGGSSTTVIGGSTTTFDSTTTAASTTTLSTTSITTTTSTSSTTTVINTSFRAHNSFGCGSSSDTTYTMDPITTVYYTACGFSSNRSEIKGVAGPDITSCPASGWVTLPGGWKRNSSDGSWRVAIDYERDFHYNGRPVTTCLKDMRTAQVKKVTINLYHAPLKLNVSLSGYSCSGSSNKLTVTLAPTDTVYYTACGFSDSANSVTGSSGINTPCGSYSPMSWSWNSSLNAWTYAMPLDKAFHPAGRVINVCLKDYFTGKTVNSSVTVAH